MIICLLFAILYGNSYSQSDLSLQSAIDIAINNNVDLKIAKSKINQEEGKSLQSISFKKPEVFLEYEGVHGFFNEYDTRKIGISQSFDFPSLYFLRNSISNYNIELAKKDYEKKRSEIIFNTKSAYLNIEYYNSIKKINSKNQELIDTLLTVSEKKLNVGIGDKIAVLQAKINKTKFESDIISTEIQLQNSYTDLSKLLGGKKDFTINDDLLSENNFLIINDMKIGSDTSYNNLDSTIDNSIAGLKLQQGEEMLSLARSSWLPEFNFSYYNITTIGSSNSFGVHLGVTVPLWFMQDTRGQIMEMEASRDAVLYDKEITMISLRRDAELYNKLLISAIKKIKLYRKEILSQTEEVMDLSKRSYEQGITNYLDYLNSQKLMNDTQVEFLNAILDYYNAVYNLEKLKRK